MTNSQIENLKGWEMLPQSAQTKVKEVTKELVECLQVENQTKLKIGEKLSEMRKILEPKQLWLSYLKECFTLSTATAYRYIEQYEKAKKLLPKAVFNEAIKSNYRGVTRIEVVRKNPPPKTKDPKEIVTYLKGLSIEKSTEPPNVDRMCRECVNFVASRYARVPGNSRQKFAFVNCVIGMIMTKFGVSSGQTFTPIAIPEVPRGRPKAA